MDDFDESIKNIEFPYEIEENIKVKQCDISKNNNCQRIIINGPANTLVLIILLMLDQLHDFGEDVRGGAKSEVTKIKPEDKQRYMEAIRTSTKNFIENFKYPDDSMVDFVTFINSTPKFKSIYDRIFGNNVQIRKLLSEAKYKIANDLVSFLSIDKENFEQLERKFNDTGNYYYPNYSCNNIKNLFYHYLIYSGYIQNGEMTKSVNITVDAHGSRYDISPILYNICDFIFSNEYAFNNVQLVRSLATEYDAAGTQGAEVYINRLEEKKDDRVSQMKELMANLEMERDTIISKMNDNFSNRKRRRNDDDNDSLRNDLEKTDYHLNQIGNNVINLENKKVGSISTFELGNSDNYIKTYEIYYGKSLLIKYNLKLLRVSFNVDISKSLSSIISKFSKLNISKRNMIVRNFLEQLYLKFYPNNPIPRNNTAIFSEINNKLPASKSIKLQLTIFNTLTFEEYIDSKWAKFLKTNKTENAKLMYDYTWDFDPNSIQSTDGNKDDKKIIESLQNKFKTSGKLKKNDTLTNDYPKFKNEFDKRIDDLLSFFSSLKSLGITEASIDSKVVIPSIENWLDYDRIKLINAKNDLVMNNQTDELREDFIKGGISQSYIVKQMLGKTSDVKEENFIYYYPFKTIGDLSQIQECTNETHKKENKDTVNIFLTFDRICGYISSLFNRTILEESDKKGNILFNLKTFTYIKNIYNFESFNSNYRKILSGKFKNFKEIFNQSEDEFTLASEKRLRLEDKKRRSLGTVLSNVLYDNNIDNEELNKFLIDEEMTNSELFGNLSLS